MAGTVRLRLQHAELYGELGEGVIHVHHLKELRSLGEEYQVDPIEDLRPVCPNCHAICTQPLLPCLSEAPQAPFQTVTSSMAKRNHLKK